MGLNSGRGSKSLLLLPRDCGQASPLKKEEMAVRPGSRRWWLKRGSNEEKEAKNKRETHHPCGIGLLGKGKEAFFKGTFRTSQAARGRPWEAAQVCPEAPAGGCCPRVSFNLAVVLLKLMCCQAPSALSLSSHPFPSLPC